MPNSSRSSSASFLLPWSWELERPSGSLDTSVFFFCSSLSLSALWLLHWQVSVQIPAVVNSCRLSMLSAISIFHCYCIIPAMWAQIPANIIKSSSNYNYDEIRKTTENRKRLKIFINILMWLVICWKLLFKKILSAQLLTDAHWCSSASVRSDLKSWRVWLKSMMPEVSRHSRNSMEHRPRVLDCERTAKYGKG